MSDKKFDKYSQTLLTPITKDKLKFISKSTGVIYNATDEDTLLVSESVSVDISSKYKNAIRTTAHEPINPYKILDKGCEKCSRKVVKYQRLGDSKKVITVCLCGNIWS